MREEFREDPQNISKNSVKSLSQESGLERSVTLTYQPYQKNELEKPTNLITHFDCFKYVAPSNKKAAEWAWKCLENLCAAYCNNICSLKTKCNIDLCSLKQKEVDWNIAQKEFHQALSYLPLLEDLDVDCPACAVSKALETFPLIASRSTVQPVHEVNLVDYYSDIVPMGRGLGVSLPCSIINKWIGEHEHVIENRCREMALLHLDAEKIPLMPPWEYEQVEKNCFPGQLVVKKIWSIKEGKPSEKEVESVEKIRSTVFRENSSAAAISSLSLKNLLVNIKQTNSFPLPEDAKWEQLSIKFADGHIVSVKFDNNSRRFTYAQMGMSCSKSGEPNKQWNLLRSFAESNGEIDWKSSYASSKLKKQKYDLSRRLKEFFNLKEDPIKWLKGEKLYRCCFTILPDTVNDY